MIEITELQKKRAENLIWSCAGDYSFTPDFKAYDSAGLADLYWNCIIGAVRRHYEYPKIESVLHSFSEEEESDTYEGLLWLGLENCVYQKEVVFRPVLASLRKRYAEAFLAENARLPVADRELLTALSLAHWEHVLGQTDELDALSRKLLGMLEFPPELSTDEIVQRAKALCLQWFQITAEEKEKTKHRLVFPSFMPRTRKGGKPRYRKFGIGFADHPEHLYGGASTGSTAGEREIKTTLSASELRQFIESKYGRPLFSPSRTAELERSLCTDSHQLCHLHFTYGERESLTGIQNAFEALSRQREAAQVVRNRNYYEDHIVRNRIAISRLSDSIRNSVLMYLQPSPVRSNNGALNSSRIWRAPILEDESVFLKNESGDPGDLCVDLLLDASTSQKNRQEIISSQAYIIAESLNRCGIPCRVLSFCSMTGYTIIRVFRDYHKPRDNRNIFDYVSNGCNRDGLAIRAVHHLIRDSPYQNKFLLILSDVKPNDVVRIRPAAGGELIPYEELAGVRDTAHEVRLARSDGIAVMCIFTGEEEDLPSARLVYGKDFVRIQSFDRLADTVGAMIQSQIRNL